MAANKNIQNDSGQAVFEFIVFLPFLIFLLTVMSTIGNAINGSINQQKALRGYYYYLVKGNSNLLDKSLIGSLGKANQVAGFFALGWREKSPDGASTAFSPCYKFNVFPGSDQNKDEICDDPVEGGTAQTNLVRVYSFYGVCSENYIIQNNSAEIDFNNRGIGSCAVRGQ